MWVLFSPLHGQLRKKLSQVLELGLPLQKASVLRPQANILQRAFLPPVNCNLSCLPAHWPFLPLVWHKLGLARLHSSGTYLMGLSRTHRPSEKGDHSRKASGIFASNQTLCCLHFLFLYLLLYSATSLWGIVRTVNVSEVPASRGGGVGGWHKKKGLRKAANMVAPWEDNL